MVAIASVRDHRLQGRARDGEIALLERAARVVETLVVASLRFRDRGARGGKTAEGFGAGRLDARDSAEHECRLTGIAGLEQSPALGKRTLDPLAVGRCHYMFPRTFAATLSGKP